MPGPGLLQTCTGRLGGRAQKAVPSNGTREMLHREHAPCSRGRAAYPATATTDFSRCRYPQ